ncbi:hypothetical protein RJ641_000266 [Dillenia turbinata]|uniref:Uncharacterized protein n=1 Tax=Dillenia turbinata TaxID=194707 RepID=A0AAN8W5W0_9MAGN
MVLKFLVVGDCQWQQKILVSIRAIATLSITLDILTVLNVYMKQFSPLVVFCLLILAQAWELWKGNRALELMDPVLKYQCSNQTLQRHIIVALLCVQEDAADRANMAEVVSVHSNEYTYIPSPNQPAFSTIRVHTNANRPVCKRCVSHVSINKELHAGGLLGFVVLELNRKP